MIENPSSPIKVGIVVEATAVPLLSGSRLRLARAAWILLALAALFILLTALPAYAESFGGQLAHVSAENQDAWTAMLASLSSAASLGAALLSMALALLFFRGRFAEPMAAVLAFYLLFYGIVMTGPLEKWANYWLGDDTLAIRGQALLIAVPSTLLLSLFPNGRFVPNWSRWPVVLSVPLAAALFFLPSYDPLEATDSERVVLVALAIGLIALLAVGLHAQSYRYRHVSNPVEHQQTKWVVYGFALWLGYIMLSSVPYFYLESLPADSPMPVWASFSVLGWFLALNILPICLAIAVTRHRLWDLEIIINRSLVYGALTACIVILYALVVGGLGALFQTQGNRVVALIATGLIAVLFQPLRERLQRWVNRLLYGQRDEPFEVLAGLGKQLEEAMSPETIYPTIVETVAQTLKLPYAAIAVSHQGRTETAVAYGKPTTQLFAFPLTYQGVEVGQLQVAPRPPDGMLTEADERLLRNIARQAGTAVHAAQLNTALQQSRQQIVTSREEERRRLRRDLHDGLGPSLAAHVLKAGSARTLLTKQPETADRLLAEMETDVENTLSELRRIVYDLRPPALDQWGLTGALKAYVETCEQSDGQSVLHIRVDAPEALSALPAAVEVAAYHIGREGITNVVRHAEARRCVVKLLVVGGEEGRLHISIQDDGRGFDDEPHAGVGLTSMRERAEELGGSLKIDSRSGSGTQVTGILPLKRNEKSIAGPTD